MHNLISMQDIKKEDVAEILRRAEFMENVCNFKAVYDKWKDRILGNLFFEPSTRTRMSFEIAMLRLNGKVSNFAEKLSLTSLEKGENLTDTIRTIDSYCDIIVIRSPKAGTARYASEIAGHPTINAGDGSNQHPTQALLDIYTIKKLKGKISGLNIALIGDLKYGRTVHSLLYGLGMFNASITLISPNDLRMPSFIIDDVKDINKNENIRIKEIYDKDKDVNKMTKEGKFNVIYLTRIQKERFADIEEYEDIKDAYKITKDAISDNTIVMHPLPRIDEIDREIDNTNNAAYFAQAKNGIPVRMAIIDYLLENFYGEKK
ncbi:MAG: aspartate carbamoyltransferase [Candidatus Altiarchaeales archaeon HGW-Altiarchaeales-1]|nr:MAG: aspartate carbamoyltransferase [Candidatus Altiarchaeales archaeon HGW-Altiarchaeales-1]